MVRSCAIHGSCVHQWTAGHMNDFKNLLSKIWLKYDHILLMGDLNFQSAVLHKTLAKEFLSLD